MGTQIAAVFLLPSLKSYYTKFEKKIILTGDWGNGESPKSHRRTTVTRRHAVHSIPRKLWNQKNPTTTSTTMARSIQNPIEKNHTTTTTTHTRLIFRSAIASRLLVIALIILWRNLLSPYDTSASINPNNCISSSSSSDNNSSGHGINIRFPRIASAIEESIVWDGVYFVRIAQCGGYEYEQSYAFLPLLPISISFLSTTGLLVGYSILTGYGFWLLI